MDWLKRAQSPITSRAWKEIDAQARHVLTTVLCSRRFVDVSAPKGLDFSAVGLGRLTLPEAQPMEGVELGVHRVQPMVEPRARFELNIWELDNIERGAKDIELAPMMVAAERIARLEDTATLIGLEAASIRGIETAAIHDAVELPLEPGGFLDAISKALLVLRRAAVEGPYALVLGAAAYRFLASYPTGYPLMKQAESLIEGAVIETDLITGGLLVSRRGGDFELTLGQDFSIGYETHDPKVVRLFITESFTFRVLAPEAVVKLGAAAE